MIISSNSLYQRKPNGHKCNLKLLNLTNFMDCFFLLLFIVSINFIPKTVKGKSYISAENSQ